MDKYYFWFSAKQREIMDFMDKGSNLAQLNTTEVVEYTQCGRTLNKKLGNWDDYKYLGEGIMLVHISTEQEEKDLDYFDEYFEEDLSED